MIGSNSVKVDRLKNKAINFFVRSWLAKFPPSAPHPDVSWGQSWTIIGRPWCKVARICAMAT